MGAESRDESTNTPYRADNRPIPFVNYEPEVNGIHKFREDPPPPMLWGLQHTEDVNDDGLPLPDAHWGWWQHIHGAKDRADTCPMAFADIDDALAALKVEEESPACDGAFRVALLGMAPWLGLAAPPAQHLRFRADQCGDFYDALLAIFAPRERESGVALMACDVAWATPRGQVAAGRGEAAWCARDDGGRDLVRRLRP